MEQGEPEQVAIRTPIQPIPADRSLAPTMPRRDGNQWKNRGEDFQAQKGLSSMLNHRFSRGNKLTKGKLPVGTREDVTAPGKRGGVIPGDQDPHLQVGSGNNCVVDLLGGGDLGEKGGISIDFQSNITTADQERRSGIKVGGASHKEILKKTGANHGCLLLVDENGLEVMEVENGERQGVTQGIFLNPNSSQLYDVHVEELEGSPVHSRAVQSIPAPYEFKASKKVTLLTQSALGGNVGIAPNVGLPKQPVTQEENSSMQGVYATLTHHEMPTGGVGLTGRGWKKRARMGTPTTTRTTHDCILSGKRKAQVERDIPEVVGGGKKCCMGTMQEQGCNQELAEAVAQPR